jgi:dimethylargininase
LGYREPIAQAPKGHPMFTRAIVRPPSATFAQGLTSVDLGVPDLALALVQHELYCAALEQCGLTLTKLAADDDFPDSTFVEDTAILANDCAILTRPGASARAGEVDRIDPVLQQTFARSYRIVAPGTVDGGDICQAGEHFFIGISERTNEAGARQLASVLQREGFTTTTIDVRDVAGILHLKSGISYLGDNRLVLIDTLVVRDEFAGYELVRIHAHERYAANCLRINDRILIAAGNPRLESSLRELGYPLIALDMSEFRKMDGALTCLSLRF